MEMKDKVIKGLECCSAYDYRCNDCPYQDDGGAEDDCYSDELYADALALLKAQEPVKVEAIPLAWFNKMIHACGTQGNIDVVRALRWVMEAWKMTEEIWDDEKEG